MEEGIDLFMKLAYITDLEPQSSGGGSYAVNWHAWRQLERHFEAVYVGPVRIKGGCLETWVSKLRRRVLGWPGRFAHFSEGALTGCAREVERRLPRDVDALVFRSAASWCRVRPVVPYFVYLDACFDTFFHNTFRPADFDSSDLSRIWREEADFLEGASGVFFECQWGMDRAIEAYGLRGKHYWALGRGGVIEPPDVDAWDGTSLSLVTMAMKFRQKGGDLVLEAYKILKPKFPGLSWHIIGGPPEGDWESEDGIYYEGVIRPDEPQGMERLRALLAQAFLLVHPTREDVSPLVVTEVSYFGCPSISVNRFALPELILDGKTGFLLDAPVTSEALASAIETLLGDRVRYVEMRREARRHAMDHYQWDVVGDRMASLIKEALL